MFIGRVYSCLTMRLVYFAPDVPWYCRCSQVPYAVNVCATSGISGNERLEHVTMSPEIENFQQAYRTQILRSRTDNPIDYLQH